MSANELRQKAAPKILLLLWLALLLTAAAACEDPEEAGQTEVDLGPIEAVTDEVAMTVWPGNVLPSGVREIRLLNGFFDGVPSAYWFAGFASRVTADVFWFCRESDTACPFDGTGVIDRSRTVGEPVFARVPGEEGYSPFWLVWVVNVPDDYAPNDIKSVHGIEEAVKTGRVTVERHIYDHGRDVGPDETIMHCLLVLDGTLLGGNGEDIVGSPGVPSRELALRSGWHKRYRVRFYEFTDNEGVFPPDEATESRPLMPNAHIFVYHRDCAGGSKSHLCAHATGDLVAVSERGVEVDFSEDGDKADNNNVISGFPRTEPPSPEDRRYSPLWKVQVVRVIPEHDADVQLIDDTLDQDDTSVKSGDTMREYMALGYMAEAEPMTEAMAGNSIPGNNGKVFFNCPSQVPAE